MSNTDTILNKIRRFIPKKVFTFFQPIYHWSLSLLAATWYNFPSKKIKIIAVTGTKGKSSTVEIINAIFEQAGYKTALSNTIRFKVADLSSENLYKMSMPGRFFIQKLIYRAVQAKCDYVIMEMTSQGSQFFRHKFIDQDVFVFTNISPEHIEAHGSYESYIQAKVNIAKQLEKSAKQDKTIIVNADDNESDKFLACSADHKIKYGLKDFEPYKIERENIEFSFEGKIVKSQLSGLFNLYNIIAAINVARSQNIETDKIISAIENFSGIPGRVQKINAGQDFSVIVDYAHTADSLEKLYQVFQSSRSICVLGGTGGGRDTKKRSVMGNIADTYCDEIILTNEDPYNEDPNKIINEVAAGIKSQTPTIILDRREAIREAVRRAKTGDSILITGKGTDPYIMGPLDTKIEWSDAKVSYEEIEKKLAGNII